MEVIGFKQVQDLILSCLNLDLFDSEFWKIHKTNRLLLIFGHIYVQSLKKNKTFLTKLKLSFSSVQSNMLNLHALPYPQPNLSTWAN